MGLFLDAARAWDELCKTSYSITLGHKGKLYNINLTFEPEDLPHLAGMQYAKDVDWGLRRAEYYGANLISSVLSGKLDELRICNARAWLRIEGRLKAIVGLQDTLSGDFIIAKFNPKKVSGACNISADYIIKNTVSGEIFFVFLAQEKNRYFCKSAFKSDCTDYMRFQTTMKVLEVVKQDSVGTHVLFRHPNFSDTASDCLTLV